MREDFHDDFTIRIVVCDHTSIILLCFILRNGENALQSLYFAYQDSSGFEPNLIGGKLSGNSSDVFRSSQEVMAAMNDPRYLQDSAYTQDVQDKLLRSDVLGPRG